MTGGPRNAQPSAAPGAGAPPWRVGNHADPLGSAPAARGSRLTGRNEQREHVHVDTPAFAPQSAACDPSRSRRYGP